MTMRPSKRQKTLERELEWIRMTPKAKQARSKARLSAYDKLASEDGASREQELEIYIPAGPRLGNIVINAEQVAKAYGDRLLFEDMNFRLPAGAIMGVIGPNGAGKTTLFRMIVGQETPDSGDFEVGDTVKLSYVDQEHETLDLDASVYDAITDGYERVQLGSKEMNGRA